MFLRLGKTIEDAPGHIQSRTDLRQGSSYRRPNQTNKTMEDLQDGGGLSELEGPLDGAVDVLVAGLAERLDGEKQHLRPSEEDGPVVEGEVEAPQGGEGTARHSRKREEERVRRWTSDAGGGRGLREI